MRVRSGGVAAAVAAGLLVAAAGAAEAQVNPRDVPIVTQPQQRFDSGQDIQRSSRAGPATRTAASCCTSAI